MFLAKMILKEILKDILSISFISVDYIKKKKFTILITNIRVISTR